MKGVHQYAGKPILKFYGLGNIALILPVLEAPRAGLSEQDRKTLRRLTGTQTAEDLAPKRKRRKKTAE